MCGLKMTNKIFENDEDDTAIFDTKLKIPSKCNSLVPMKYFEGKRTNCHLDPDRELSEPN